MKRILILEGHQAIVTFYREKLEGAGVTVDVAGTGDAAVKAIADTKPDAVLLDLLVPTADAVEIIRQIKAGAAPGNLQIIALPTPLRNLGNAAARAGATLLSAQDAGDGLAQIHELLGLPAPVADPAGNPAQVRSTVEAAPELVNAMRRCLHALVKDQQNASLSHDLLRQIHVMSERLRISGLQAVYRLTSTLEALVYEFHQMPEHVNASTIRTVGQTVDFLVTLFEEENLSRIKDPSAAEVFAVDDEIESCRTITAAMEMVRLKISCAQDPEAGLAVLSRQMFDLIFLDVGLPGMSGFDLCKKVRALPIHEKTPVVFLTGMATFQNRAQSSLSGGNDFIGKPFNLVELGVKALIWIFKGQLGLRQ